MPSGECHKTSLIISEVLAWCCLPMDWASVVANLCCHMVSLGHNELLSKWFLNSLRPSDAYMRQYTNHHWFREWLVAWSAPSHYLNQSWNIVNWTLRNKLQWNFNHNSYIFIDENAFENVVWKMAAIFLGLNLLKRVIFYSDNDTTDPLNFT